MWVDKYLFETVLSIPLGIYPEMGLLDHMVILFNFLRNHHIIFNSSDTIVHSSTSTREFQFLHIFTDTYFFCCCLDSSILRSGKQFPLWFDCITLMTMMLSILHEHLAMCISPLQKYLCKSFAHCLLGYVLYCCQHEGVLYIFWMWTPHQVCDLQVFFAIP